MKLHIIAVILLLVLCACSPSPIPAPTKSPTPSAIGTNTPVPTKTATSTPKPTSAPTFTPTPTELPTETAEPSATPIILQDPRLTSLEKSGFVQEDRYQKTQGKFSYIQYHDDKNCALVFTISENNKNRVLSIILASSINNRLKEVTSDPMMASGIICGSYEWGDINRNGKPDLPVVFSWANQITGSEVHIFEINDNLTVSDLTKDLPGIVSPYTFPPSGDTLWVDDITWAKHDCIYPPMTSIYWVFAWRDGRYVDITGELDYSKTIDKLTSTIKSLFGKPLSQGHIESLTRLLLTYDRVGLRDKGWQEYTALANMKNWPNTDEKNIKWMQSDLSHFEKQYRAKQPFTPNDYCVDN
jgi:hypothetical protein